MSYWSLSIPPENIRKPLILLCFQGVWKETSGMKWVERPYSTFWYKSALEVYHILKKTQKKSLKKEGEFKKYYIFPNNKGGQRLVIIS